MTALIIANETEITSVSTPDLKQALISAIDDTVSAIRRAAAIWAELERRGEDLSDVNFALRVYMRPVAEGRLLPEVLSRLAGQRRTLDLVATLPPPEQQRVVIDETPIEVVTADGEITTKSLPAMTWPEVARVIRDGAVRTPAEQQASIARTLAAKAPRPRGGRPARIHVDTKHGVVKIGVMQVPLDRLLAALRVSGVLP